MKKFILAIIPILMVTISPIISAQDRTAVNQADIDAIERAQADLTVMAGLLDDLKLTEDELQMHAEVTAGSLAALMARNFSDVSSDYLQAGTVLRDVADELSNDILLAGGLTDESEGYLSMNRVEKQSFINRYNGHISEFNQAVRNLDQAASLSNEAIEERGKASLIALTWIIAPALLTLALYSWAARGKSASNEIKNAKKSLATSALVLTIGVTITAGTYIYAARTGGETYTAAYGLILAGAIYFIVSLANLFKVSRGGTGAPPNNPA